MTVHCVDGGADDLKRYAARAYGGHAPLHRQQLAHRGLLLLANGPASQLLIWPLICSPLLGNVLDATYISAYFMRESGFSLGISHRQGEYMMALIIAGGDIFSHRTSFH